MVRWDMLAQACPKVKSWGMGYTPKQLETGEELVAAMREHLNGLVEYSSARIPIEFSQPFVEGPSAGFLVALTKWDVDPSGATWRKLRNAHGAARDAWTEASKAYARLPRQ